MTSPSSSQDVDDAGEGDRYIYAQRLRCRHCGCTDLPKTAGPRDQGDGTQKQYARCAGCRAMWVIVWE